MSESVLRQIYTNIGIADKEGNFPIKNLMEKSKQIDDFGLSAEKASRCNLNYYRDIVQNLPLVLIQHLQS